jgi:D-alanyl-D-alanine carboxypeptidase (penicillin-binding protein 5/6)
LFRKVSTAVLVAALMSLAVGPAHAQAPPTHGRAALLLDGVSGQLLYHQNGLVKNFPASTTKLLTALVAAEHGNMDDIIMVSSQAVDKPWDSSSCLLEPGEQQPLRYLLTGLLLVSGNDCADAIAEGVSSGRPEQFITWMNETAIRLGATQSHFTNPSGLHDPDHYTTALDLALIARAALANPIVQQLANTKQFHWPDKSERNGIYYNLNAMVFTYDGSVGGKTGFTEEAGLTLVTAAKRGNQLLIAVVLDEPSRSHLYLDAEALLDYGFASFQQVPIVTIGKPYGTVPVIGGTEPHVTVVAQKEFLASLPLSGGAGITASPRLESALEAPVTIGQQVGVVEIRDGARLVGTVPVVTQTAVNADPVAPEEAREWSYLVLRWIGLLLGGLLLFRFIVKRIRRRLRQRNRRRSFHLGAQHTYSINVYRPRDRSGRP